MKYETFMKLLEEDDHSFFILMPAFVTGTTHKSIAPAVPVDRDTVLSVITAIEEYFDGDITQLSFNVSISGDNVFLLPYPSGPHLH